MITAALVVAIVALLIALAALAKSSNAAARFDEIERGAARRADSMNDQAGAQIEVLKQHVAVLAEGGKLTREQILEGRLWSDVSPGDGVAFAQRGGVRLIDVRTAGETALGIIPGALLIPVNELEARLKELPRDGATMLVYCASGGRSVAACEMLVQHGFTNLHNLEGGFSAWSGPRAKP